jgi:hypothetical protein
MFYQ